MAAVTRRLATIVALDVAGYSARVEADEAKTTVEIATLGAVIAGIAKAHGGRVFNTAGDGFMLEFGSSLAAVEAALELAETCEPKVRVGVHLGDVAVQSNGDMLGHGVNVAARLMARSAPGAALVSGAVRHSIRGPVADRLQSCGMLKLDKMSETIEAFSLGAMSSVIVAAQPKSLEPILAVLPFDNLSGDSALTYFSDGLTEEILRTIAHGAAIKVIGRNSSFQFRGERKAAPIVAHELGATHILDGAVRRSDKRVRISVHLIEALSQTTLWSDRFDDDVADVFGLQDRIAERVATALDRTFAARARPRDIDPAAYDLYLRGAELARDIRSASQHQAIVLLDEVTRRAPNFASAWGELAVASTQFRFLHFDRAGIELPSRAAVDSIVHRALALDPHSERARLARYINRPNLDFSGHVGAFANPHRTTLGIAASPDLSLGVQLLEVGRVDESVEFFRQAEQFDPLFQIQVFYQAQALAAFGNVNDAGARMRAAVERWPYIPFFAAALISWAVQSDDWPTVSEMTNPDRLERFPLLHLAESVATQIAASRSRDASPESFRHMRDCDLAIGNSGLVPILAHARIAGLTATLAMIEAEGASLVNFAAPRRPDDLGSIALFLPSCASVRREPSFARLCARLGLVRHWQDTDHWPDCADDITAYDFRKECIAALEAAGRSTKPA